MFGFNNTEVAFITKTNNQLIKAWWLFKIVSSPFLVKAGKLFISVANTMRLPIKWLIKPTIYSHFCGGENLDECSPTVEMLARHNVKSILDYSVEGKETDEDIELAMQETLKAIEHAAGNPQIPFAVFKPTAFAPFHILEKAAAEALHSEQEKHESLKFEERIETLFRRGYELNIPVMIDAEETWIQDYIDRLVKNMMEKYNLEKVVVFNTLQMYRHDRLEFLEKSLSEAKEGNYLLGIKLVRGAYMEKERARAEKHGIPSPIYPDKPSTDKAYNDALSFCVANLDRIQLFNGTHNEESCIHLMKLMREKGITPEDKRIFTSQLFGMSDHISFNMAREGYNVAKYIPYGPVKHVLPYLIRRAEENTSVAGQTGRELSLLSQEKKRRRNKKTNHAD
jgi:proline dehydrogenase